MSDIEFTTRLVNPSATFRWKIEKFSSIKLKPGKSLITPLIECYSGVWVLILCPNGNSTSNAGKVGFYLQKISRQPPENYVTFHMSIQDKNGILQYTLSHQHLFKHKYISGCDRFIGSQILLGEKRDELLPEDTLTVVCKITDKEMKAAHSCVTSNNECKDKGTKIPDYVSPLETLSQEFEKLYLSGEGSDLILKSDDQLFKAHKAVLAARSANFATMFRNNMMETEKNTVDIPDIPAFLIPDVLRYMYTGKLKGLSSERATKLLRIAERYGMSGLESICRRVMLHPLSVANFCSAVFTAYTFFEEKLKEDLIEFLIQHIREILQTEQWNTLQIENTSFASSLLQAVLLKISK